MYIVGSALAHMLKKKEDVLLEEYQSQVSNFKSCMIEMIFSKSYTVDLLKEFIVEVRDFD